MLGTKQPSKLADGRQECRSNMYFKNRENGMRKHISCRSWGCERCAPRVAARWAHRIAREDFNFFITITQVPEDLDAARLAWQHLLRDLRSDLKRVEPRPLGFEFVRFTERGEQNAMKHYHILALVADLETGDFDPWFHINLRAFQELLKKHGYGHINRVENPRSKEKSAWYCAKYVTKTGTYGFVGGERKLAYSKGFFRKELTDDELLAQFNWQVAEEAVWNQDSPVKALMGAATVAQGLSEPG